jgi:hypothetical protein
VPVFGGGVGATGGGVGVTGAGVPPPGLKAVKNGKPLFTAGSMLQSVSKSKPSKEACCLICAVVSDIVMSAPTLLGSLLMAVPPLPSPLFRMFMT